MLNQVKCYKVPIVISEAAFKGFSLKVQKLVREIDRVSYKGRLQKLYCLDISGDGCIEVEDQNLFKTYQEKRVIQRDEKLDLWTKRFKFKISPFILITSDPDWKEMRQVLDRPSHLRFKSLVEAYLRGDWYEAIRCLKELDAIKVKDGPTEQIR